MEFEDAGQGEELRSTTETRGRDAGNFAKDHINLLIATNSSKEEHKLGIGIIAKLNGAQIKVEWALVEKSSN